MSTPDSRKAPAKRWSGYPIKNTLSLLLARCHQKYCYHQCQQYREQSAQCIKDSYNPCKSVVDWDSKLISDFSSCDVAVRLPVLLTSAMDGDSKLLGVPAWPTASGRDTSKAVLMQLQSCNCDSPVVGMCFDTTATSNGRHSAVCNLLENWVEICCD